MKIAKIGVWVLAAGALISTCFAGMMTREMRLPLSSLEFKVDTTLHETEGKVTSFSVTPIHFDFDKPQLQEKVEVTVPVASMVTGMDSRDWAMRRMFDVSRYPKIFYRAATAQCSSQSVDLLGCTVPGALTIRDKTLPVPLQMTVRREGAKLRASGTARISLKAFNLRPPSVLGILKVFDEVTVSFNTVWDPSVVPEKALS